MTHLTEEFRKHLNAGLTKEWKSLFLIKITAVSVLEKDHCISILLSKHFCYKAYIAFQVDFISCWIKLIIADWLVLTRTASFRILRNCFCWFAFCFWEITYEKKTQVFQVASLGGNILKVDFDTTWTSRAFTAQFF